MARARNIKPGFFKNEVLAEMPMEARMLFIGLWTLADREGRLEDRPKRIKMELFPYDSFDVDPMLSRLQADGFLTRYDVGGVRFMQIENFVKHQDPHYKEKASEIPPPEGVEDIIKATAVTRGQRVRILERDGYRCQSCGAESHLCIDHVIPVSRGGDSSDDNLQVLCHSCNTKKGNKLDGEEKGQKKSIHRPGAVIARPNVGSNSNQQKCTLPSDSLSSDSLIPDTPILNSVAIATGGDAAKPAADLTKDELWKAGKSLLEQSGMPKAQCGSFVGKLVKDYGDVIVVDAVRSAVLARPADPVEYLKATCMRTAGQRATVNKQEALEQRNRSVADAWAAEGADHAAV